MESNQIVLLFVSIVAVGVCLLAAITLTNKKQPLNRQYYEERLKDIEELLDNDDIQSYENVVMNADKLLDHALREAGIKGDTMGTRLKKVSSRLKHRDDVWAAHKLRNRIAHEEGVRVSHGQAKKALVSFKSALHDIGAI